MSTRALVQPDLLPGLDLFPTIDLDPTNLAMVRAMLAQAPIPPIPEGIEVRTATATSSDGTAVRLLIYQAARGAGAGPRPAILHMHGGGYVFGAPEMMAAANCQLVKQLGCVVASVDYRLAPEAKHPTPLEDCYAGLRWLHANADALNIDPHRIALKGESAGGGLAAALALLARDRGDAPIAFQALIYPMIDDRPETPPNPHTGEFIWTAASNAFGWSCLLGCAAGGPDTPPYAAASRAADLSRLPPAFIYVGALDLFVDANIAYARRLLRAGVPTQLHVYPGAYHGFEIAAEAATTRQAGRDCLAALATAFARLAR